MGAGDNTKTYIVNDEILQTQGHLTDMAQTLSCALSRVRRSENQTAKILLQALVAPIKQPEHPPDIHKVVKSLRGRIKEF